MKLLYRSRKCGSAFRVSLGSAAKAYLVSGSLFSIFYIDFEYLVSSIVMGHDDWALHSDESEGLAMGLTRRLRRQGRVSPAPHLYFSAIPCSAATP